MGDKFRADQVIPDVPWDEHGQFRERHGFDSGAHQAQWRRQKIAEGKCPMCVGPLTDGMMCPDERHTDHHGPAWFNVAGDMVTEQAAKDDHELYRKFKGKIG